MADDLRHRGEPDRSRINMNEDYEVRHWMKAFGATREELEEAIRRVGNGADAVRQELGRVRQAH